MIRGEALWEPMREMASRRSRVLPIPGAASTVTTMGLESSTARSKALITCASSASRPVNGAPLTISRLFCIASPTMAEPSPRIMNS